MNNADILHFHEYLGDQVNQQGADKTRTTRIPNAMLDAIILHGFSQYQLTILMLIIRQTIGYNKPSDELALGQIHDKTGIHKGHASLALKNLEEMNIISIQPGHHANCIILNKDFTTWRKVTESVTRYGKRNSELRNPEPQKTTPKVDKEKEEMRAHDAHVQAFLKELPSLKAKAFEVFWLNYPNKDKKKEARQRFEALPYNPDLYAYINQRVCLFKAKKRAWLDGYIPNPATFIYKERWTDALDVERMESFTAEQQALVNLYNDKCGAKFAPLLEFHPDRAAHIDRMLEKKSLDVWERYFDYMMNHFDAAKLDSLPGFEFITSAKTYNAAVEGRI